MMSMVKMMWGVCLLLVAIVVVALVRGSTESAAPGEWGELTSGSAAATARTLVANPAFEEDLLPGWAHRPHFEGAQKLTKGTISKESGRTGGAFAFEDEKAAKGEVAATFTRETSHCDYFFDGYARGSSKSGKGWYGIEISFEDSKGARIASFLSWRGLGGGKPPSLPNRTMEELAPAENGWGRLSVHTSFDLRLKGLEMPQKPQFMSVNLWLGLEDAEASAWFDDLDLRDMKAGR